MTPQEFIDIFRRATTRHSLNDQMDLTHENEATIYPDMGEHFYIELDVTISPQLVTMSGGMDDYGNREYFKDAVGCEVYINDIHVSYYDEDIKFEPLHITELEEIITKSL